MRWPGRRFATRGTAPSSGPRSCRWTPRSAELPALRARRARSTAPSSTARRCRRRPPSPGSPASMVRRRRAPRRGRRPGGPRASPSESFMRILRGLPSFPAELAPSVTALGAFDGIHLAHAKILRTTVERARALGVAALACTYEPHPAVVLHPDRAPAPIATPEENLARMARAGTRRHPRHPVHAGVLPHRGRGLRRGRPGADGSTRREVVVGYNHTFGRDARGTAALLQIARARVTASSPMCSRRSRWTGQTVSSSAIREALREGDPARARVFLGHPYAISGPVLRGAGRGRTLGFPTANLRPDRPLILAARRLRGAGALVRRGRGRHGGGRGQYRLPPHLRRAPVLGGGLPAGLLGRPLRPDR